MSIRIVLCTIFVLLTGCQSAEIIEERRRLVERSDDAVLCYSLIDHRFQLDQNAVLKELKSRSIDSCLTIIAEYECPESMESRQTCIDDTEVRITGEVKGTQSSVGTEFLIKGMQVGIGVLPF